MKLDSFFTLDAVLRTGTLAAAAGEINLTPSAVSMKMKQLEQYLGQPLFDRSGLQVRPTRLAYDVAATMRESMQRLESLRRRPRATIEGLLRFGIIDSMQTLLLPGMLRRLRDDYPGLEVRPLRGRSQGLAAALKAGTIDAALIAQPEPGTSSTRLHWQPMMRREMVLLAPPEARETTVPALFRQYEWIRYDKDTVSGSIAARYVQTHIRERRPGLEFDSISAIVAMVSSGLGVAVVQIADPRLLHMYPVRMLRLGRGAPSVQFSLATRKADNEHRGLDVLRGAMTTVLTELQRQRTSSGL
jgi:DNA-binding transcriptional LysR family regulator